MELVYIALLPVVVLLVLIYKLDVEAEPRGKVALIFVLGCISTIPIAIAELALGYFFPSNNLPTFMGTFVTIFLTVALMEEFGKWVITYLVIYRNKEFNHLYDGMVYAVFASLGFACIENILYVCFNGLGTGVIRALLSVPSHAVDAVFMGYLLSKSKSFLVDGKNTKSFIYLFLSIIVPTIVHAIYDALLFHFQSSENWILLILFLMFVIVSYIVAIVLLVVGSKVQRNFDGSVVVKNVKR